MDLIQTWRRGGMGASQSEGCGPIKKKRRGGKIDLSWSGGGNNRRS